MYLLVEGGTLVVQADQPFQVQGPGRAGDPGHHESRTTGPIELSPGERIALSANTGYALRSAGNEAAVVLSAAVLAGDAGPTNRWVRVRSFDEILFNPGELEVVAQNSAPSSWPPGVRSELIAYGIIKMQPAELATLELTRLTFAPNGALPVHRTSAELLAIDTGTAVVDLVAGDGAIRPHPQALQATLWPQAGSSVRDRGLTEGGSAVLQPGSSAGVRNVGDVPLVLLILTLEPGPGVSWLVRHGKRHRHALSKLGREPSVAGGFIPVDIQPARHVREQFGQLHGVPGAAAAARLLEGVGAPFVGA
jgi:hypothetical protein